MAERTSTGLLTMMLEPTPAVGMTLPAEVREKLAELELELSEGKVTLHVNEQPHRHAKVDCYCPQRCFKQLTAIANHRPIVALWLTFVQILASPKPHCYYQSLFPKPNFGYSFLLMTVIYCATGTH